MKLVLGLLGLLLVMPVWADTPLDIKYGANEVDINADGVKDLIVKARWDNGNAHSFDRYMVMVKLKGEYRKEEFYEVPKGDSHEYKFHTTEGADCLRVGYAFKLDDKGMLVVTRYALAEGVDYYCEAQAATITTYQLVDGEKLGLDAAGLTPFYLEQVKEKKLLKKYESVEGLMK